MKLWKISQDFDSGYDTYDSAVVAAETQEEARNIHPGPYKQTFSEFNGWATSPSQVVVEEIGEAIDGTESGTVICASFNAG